MVVTRIKVGLIAVLVILSTLLVRMQDVVEANEVVLHAVTAEDRGLLGEEPDHLMWFMQISDIHLSMFGNAARAADFSKFCTETVDAVRPAVVLATGDLTDGMSPNHVGSGQFLEEWKTYHDILNETDIVAKTHYLDIRGNHDNFNVMFPNSRSSLYRKYSVRGQENPRSYIFFLNHGGDDYAFVAVDASTDPGPKRPFNFMGVITEDEYKTLEELALKTRNSTTLPVWFGHYPTSTIAAPKVGLRKLMNGPYLCGHLHTLGGMLHNMYGLQTSGFLELELGDWKDHRRFRVAAIDHGLFSFIDVTLNRWPIILVTNPKHALFTMPLHEPLHQIRKSTHIRVLVFSVKPVELVKVRINSEDWRNATLSSSNLYVIPWNPMDYSSGLHKLEIYAEDADGYQQSVVQSFSLDGSHPSFPVGAQFVIRGRMSIVKIVFGVVLMLTVLPLFILRLLHTTGKARMIRIHAEENCIRRGIFKLYLVASTNRLFWPLITLSLYVATGPWFIGEIIDGHISVCFVWGLIVSGSFLPGGATFVVGTIFLLTVYLPMMICLSNATYHRYRNLCYDTYPTHSFATYLCRNCVLLLLVLWQVMWTVGFYLSYGLFAVLFGILNTWSIVLVLLLWRLASTLPESCFPYLLRSKSNEEEHWDVSGSLSLDTDVAMSERN